MISPNVFRTGKFYQLRNHGDLYVFQIISFEGENDYLLKDYYTLETYHFSDLIRYGKGNDFTLEEFNAN